MGNIDLFHSRRTNYDRCVYWIRDESDAIGTPEQWIVKRKPSGHFYAKEISAKSSQMDVLNGVWAFDKDHITLETDDDVSDISRGTFVRYADELWLVESIQREIHRKESEFNRHTDYRYVVAMTRG